MKKLYFTLFAIILLFALTATGYGNRSITSSDARDTSKAKNDNSPVYTIVELMPSYPGGENAMYKFLSDSIKYPQQAKELGISGTVIISFVVEKDGSITNLKALKDIGYGCGDEAINVIKSMPTWVSGKQQGVNVRVQFYMPIRYTLTNGKEKKHKNKK